MWFVHRDISQRKWSTEDAASDKSRWVVTLFHNSDLKQQADEADTKESDGDGGRKERCVRANMTSIPIVPLMN
uniref:Uncharacterized protein n=1 Tax=Oryza rufipogon TaxID=4529 RepID=A0A0E0RB74_ORYRU